MKRKHFSVQLSILWIASLRYCPQIIYQVQASFKFLHCAVLAHIMMVTLEPNYIPRTGGATMSLNAVDSRFVSKLK